MATTLRHRVGSDESDHGPSGHHSPPACGGAAFGGLNPAELDVGAPWASVRPRRRAAEQVLTNARIVARETIFEGTVHVMGGRIVALDDGRSRVRSAIDLERDLLLPGLVDVHTDNLERHLEPRPDVAWPPLPALVAHDRQMVAAGITTVLDSLCIGDRQSGRARRSELLPDALQAMRHAEAHGMLAAQHLLHLRCEVSSDSVASSFAALADEPLLRLVSLMDHTPGQRQWADPSAWRRFARDLSEEQLTAIRAERQGRDGSAARQEIAKLCRLRGMTLASHDDATVAHVEQARELGVTIGEFPTTLEAAHAARAAGMRVVMGAPNIVLGGSHSGNVAAKELFAAELVDVLASDYVPNSLLQACFRLHARLGLTLPAAVATASAAPAAILRMEDRGELSPGRRADMVRVRIGESDPVVAAVWREGMRVA